ncbi:U4/U6 small nuclear ribonucleoprotein Prp31 [Protopterus annectens]|uniref:U4/U6 small nuclear ribonucleoprotein Prp31 n=1 Tax=Protopterus annectens TaxID=7888 RepID=UPI001CF94B96|nr:U4/U6 small nuclear ribonucleoprotein Prp31 [Protopterus annectens]
MSLADELLADLEEAAEEDHYVGEDELEDIEEVAEDLEIDTDVDSVKSIAKLRDSKMFADIVRKIEVHIGKPRKAAEVVGPVEADPEYKLIVDANNLTVEIDNELNIIHKYVRDKYAKRFPELESLVPNSLDYIRTVKELGNSLDKCKNNENLRIAGGLTNLSKMPACNVMLLGAQRKTLSGFSSTSVLPHTGFIYHSEIVQSLPPDLRRKAARLASAKCTLAARVDSFHESTDGKVGYELKEEIERKFDKWQEPPPVKQVKPLPAPLDGMRKKRGGRRYRKMKERLGLTEIRKQANRMTFGEIEEDAYQEDLGFSLGHLGKSGSGRVRQAQVNEATKARISKSLQRTLQKQSMVYGGKSTIRDRASGTASSVAFTPLQGLEIVNPQAAEKKVAEANQKYFSNMAEFLKVKREKNGQTSTLTIGRR